MRAAVPIPSVAAAFVLHFAALGGSVVGDVGPVQTFGELKGGPEPLENEINKILGSKRDDRFSDHFSDLVQNICWVRFSYQLCLIIFCKVPRDMRKFPQKYQKIAGC